MSLVISKAIKLIDLVAEGLDSLADIAKASAMSRSTTHRLLATLVEHNYLAMDAKRYTLGYRLLELGEQKKRSLNFVDALHKVLIQYAERTSDTIHLAVLDGKDIVLIDRVAGSRQLQIDSFIGQRATACTTAVGKVLIGQTDPRDWKGYLHSLPASYPKTRAQLLEEFRTAQLRNYAVDFDECDVGTCGVAASFFAIKNRLRVACSINGATVYFRDGRLQQLIGVVQQMAAEMEQIALQISPDVGIGSPRRNDQDAKAALSSIFSR